MSDERIVYSETHTYFATRERDMGVLDKGAFKGLRFITFSSGTGESPEAAAAALERGPSLTGYRLEPPS